jgi:hypothetical protein
VEELNTRIMSIEDLPGAIEEFEKTKKKYREASKI